MVVFFMKQVLLLCDKPTKYKWIEDSLNKEGFNVVFKQISDNLIAEELAMSIVSDIIINTVSEKKISNQDLDLIKKSLEGKFGKKLFLAFYNDNERDCNSIELKSELMQLKGDFFTKKEFIDILIQNSMKNSPKIVNQLLSNDVIYNNLEKIFVKLTSINQLLNDFGKKYVKDISSPLKLAIKDLDCFLMNQKNNFSTRLNFNFFDHRKHIRDYFASLGFFNYTIKTKNENITMVIDSKHGISIIDNILTACVSSCANNKIINIFESITESGLEIEFKFLCADIKILKSKIRFVKRLVVLSGGEVKIDKDGVESAVKLVMPDYRVKIN